MKRDELDFTISFSNLYFELLNIDNDLSEFTTNLETLLNGYPNGN